MKNEMEDLRSENKQLKQQQEAMHTQLQQILQHLPGVTNIIGDSSTQPSHGDKSSTGT